MGAFASKPPTAPTFQLAAPAPTTSSKVVPILGAMAMIALLFVIIFSFKSVSKSFGFTTGTDQAPTEIDGKVGATTSSNMSGSNSNMQFWMYIKDWDYKFGEEKHVIAQTSSTNANVSAPKVTLHPTDNALQIAVSVYPSSSNLDTTNTGSGEVQTVTVENVPLQSWFAVSITIYGRNLDVYINGQLVKSAVLAGVPMPASGSLVIGGSGGFSGSICTVYTSANQLQPADAASFYAGGTACSTSTGASSSSQLSNLSLFGYTFVFGVKDNTGKQVSGLSSSDISGWFSSTK